MSRGWLRDGFAGVAHKRLSAVDVPRGRSNQHEIGGRDGFARLLGTAANRMRKEGAGIPTRYVRLTDDPDDTLRIDDAITWYDTRHRDPRRKPEWRLYYPRNDVTAAMAEGDLFVLAKRRDDTLLAISAPWESSVARQLQWLFGFHATGALGTLLDAELGGSALDFQARAILEDLGLDVSAEPTGFLDTMLARFGPAFPSTRDFSAFARSTLRGIDAAADPCGALLAWFEREDRLFRELEEHIVAARIREGFEAGGRTDVAAFVIFSLSVQNRRKSRAGYAFGHHIAEVFARCGLTCEAEVLTEGAKRIDFMLPSGAAYHDPEFPRDRLIALGAKTTCKDRWRQVLSEAHAVPRKHLLTLETRISNNQLAEMAAADLRLVIPRARHWDFGEIPDAHRPMTVAAFIAEARERAAPCGANLAV